jgi:16S rRNA processing protein RimM
MNQPSADWIWLARIRKPQGRKGEVFAEILTDFPEKFAERRRLWLICATEQESDQGGKPESRKGGTSVPPQSPPKKDLGFSPCSEPREAHLLHHWLHKGGVVLHFAGVDSISAAETIAGLIVAIPRSERAALAEDEVYIADLIGCALVDVVVDPPVMIGEIEDVDRTAGAAPLLIVKGANGEVLVPFAKSYLRRVDLEGRRVEMALPEGLADLNA